VHYELVTRVEILSRPFEAAFIVIRIDDEEHFGLVSGTFVTRNSHVTVTFLIRSNHGSQVTPPCDLVGSIHPRREPSRHN
jgi:hypothetical protein